MNHSLRKAFVAAMLSLSLCASAKAAPSAENNPFASTQLQVDARLARIQQEVDRLRAAGQFTAASDLTSRLSHFQLERSGLQGSAIPGPELDVVGMYTANGDTPIVEIRPTDRPVVLALGAYELVHWTLQVFPGANLQRVIVSGHDRVDVPGGVPAGVGVELTSYTNTNPSYFYFEDRVETNFSDAAKLLYQKTGLPPSTMQAMHHYLGQHIAIGGGTVEWTQERVLSEMQPLYKEATAFQLAADRSAAEAYQFNGLLHTYSSDGTWRNTRVALMTPTRALNVMPAPLDYFHIGVDPRGSGTYYGDHPGHRLEKFNPVTGETTALPAYAGAFGAIQAMSFDTKRNRLALITTGGDSANGFLFFNPDAGTWQRSALVTQLSLIQSMAYSALNDAYFAAENGANGAAKLDRFDGSTLAKSQIELSQYVNCGVDRCQLAASGDRLILITAPAVDVYEPLGQPVQHSYLIDPTNGNVTILGAVPEPALGITMGLFLLPLRRRYCPLGVKL